MWRVSGLLVATGLMFDLLLSGPFLVIGFASMLVGAVVLVVHLEASMLRTESLRAADLEETAPRPGT